MPSISGHRSDRAMRRRIIANKGKRSVHGMTSAGGDRAAKAARRPAHCSVEQFPVQVPGALGAGRGEVVGATPKTAEPISARRPTTAARRLTKAAHRKRPAVTTCCNVHEGTPPKTVSSSPARKADARNRHLCGRLHRTCASTQKTTPAQRRKHPRSMAPEAPGQGLPSGSSCAREEGPVARNVPNPRLAGRGWHERWPPPAHAKRRRIQLTLPALLGAQAASSAAAPAVASEV